MKEFPVPYASTARDAVPDPCGPSAIVSLWAASRPARSPKPWRCAALELELDAAQPRVVVRGSPSTVASRFFTGKETPRRPLKGRGERASRTVPVPRELAGLLRHHLDAYVGKRQDALVFTTPPATASACPTSTATSSANGNHEGEARNDDRRAADAQSAQ